VTNSEILDDGACECPVFDCHRIFTDSQNPCDMVEHIKDSHSKVGLHIWPKEVEEVQQSE